MTLRVNFGQSAEATEAEKFMERLSQEEARIFGSSPIPTFPISIESYTSSKKDKDNIMHISQGALFSFGVQTENKNGTVFVDTTAGEPGALVYIHKNKPK